MIKLWLGFLLFLMSACSTAKKALNEVDFVPEGHEMTSRNAMVVAQGKYSSMAGKKMFELGGNVVDAATAISFAISVERPQSTGLGGGGFMLLKLAGERLPFAFDFREMAPEKSHQNMFLNDFAEVIPGKSLDGIWAVGVPGMVAGVLEVHRRFGRLSLSQVMAPAIDLAENGFEVYPELEKALALRAAVLAKYEASKAIFFKGDSILKSKEKLIQKDLAHTLKKLAKEGAKAFYEGSVGKAIVLENQRLGGLITMNDLKNYTVIERTPVFGTYKGLEVFSMPPPSSGGIHVIQILNILENDSLTKWGVLDPRSIHLTAEAMKSAFYDRARYLGDSDFVDVPIEGLTSKKYAAEIRKQIHEEKVLNDLNPELNAFTYESHETTHFSVMDSEGNAVVSTQTINGPMGSGVVVPGTGILLNNEMDDFAAKEGASNLFGALGGKNNLIVPKKRPLSSMSPTLVMKDKFPILALGTPSGTRILTCVAQTLLNYLEYKLPLYDAVASLRFHHQYSPPVLYLSPGKWPDSTVKRLRMLGHDVQEKDLGCRIQAIAYEGDTLHGVSDPRGEGQAVGY